MTKRLLAIAFFLLTSNAYSQQEIKFKHLNTNHGLSQSFVLSIAQDKKGFMWIATYGGLNKYDGYKFTAYHHNVADSTSLRNNRIRALLADSKGRLWIGTESGLDQFDAQRNIFVHVKIDLCIVDIMEDSQGNIWVCTDKGLTLIDSHNNKPFQTYSYENKKFRMACEDKAGKFWILLESNSSILVFNPKDHTFHSHPLPPDFNKEGKSRIEDLFVLKDHTGVMWFSLNNYLYRYDSVTTNFIEHNHGNGVSGNIHSLVEDADGNLWICSRNGISVLDKARKNLSFHQHSLDNDDGLSENFIITMYRDASDNLWIGSRNTGLNIVFRAGNNFKLYKHQAGNPQSLNNNVVKAIVKDKQGKLWFGTDGGGLNLYNKDGSFSFYKHDPKDPNSLPNNLILAD
jgi:ligand-binding sensor domain-containing protein